MPEYTFDGPPATTYPSSKDSADLPVGTVEPGGIRDLDGPLDHWWRETTDEDRAGAGTEAAASASLQPPASPAPAPPAAPQPAPPAQIFPQPVPSASTEQQEG